jgi:hypothetical protein
MALSILKQSCNLSYMPKFIAAVHMKFFNMMQKPSLTIVSWSLKGLTPKTLLTGTWS